MKICKAANISKECLNCRHTKNHEHGIDCFLRSCNVQGKDVRCIVIEPILEYCKYIKEWLSYEEQIKSCKKYNKECVTLYPCAFFIAYYDELDYRG